MRDSDLPKTKNLVIKQSKKDREKQKKVTDPCNSQKQERG